MKVTLGPYIYRWTTTSAHNAWLEWRHGKGYWEVDEDDYTLADKIVDLLLERWQTVLNLTVNQIQDRRKKVQKIRIDKFDTWNMDATLSPIIYPMLVQLKATTHGAPNVDDEDVSEELKSTNAPTVDREDGEVDDNHFKRWDYVLDEMIWAFAALSDPDWEDQFHTGDMDILWTPVDKDGNVVSKEDAKLYRMDKGPNDTHKVDMKGRVAADKRIANGTRLFGKYFRSLWD